ncbi:hypothetical protein K505DRAFT_364316 [Melanomma pulvis-pyrius CBS 109.77]|uniref:Uncharacterized protein n=1 Tax=Melanomma pulvis-pyrius CBS 109.77 TaxID=1314802 RepID=A0A6A6X3H0_9PLEO|nr:hypothetical protein K505DRAFT_364316 [Melanomma pulvis-pyrius CBS 109.77]
MSGPDENAEDVRAICAILKRKTEKGLKALPAFDQVTWNNAQFLIGYTQGDGEKVYAHYVKKSGSIDSAKVHNYYKEGKTTVLSLEEWNGMNYEVPVRYIMDSELGDSDKRGLVSAFVKACFSMRGVTRGAAYIPTANFKQMLGRSITILMQKEDGEDAPQAPINNLETTVLPLGSPSSTARNGSSTELDYRPRGMSSSGSVDSDDGRGRARKYDLGTSNLARSDLAKAVPLKRKSFGMFSDMDRANYAKKWSSKESDNTGMRLTRNGKKQQGLKTDLQVLEAKAEARKDNIRKTIEAQLAAVNTELHSGRSKVLKLLEEEVQQQQGEEAKAKEKSRVIMANMDKLKAMEQAGGFELGGAVTDMKRQGKN